VPFYLAQACVFYFFDETQTLTVSNTASAASEQEPTVANNPVAGALRRAVDNIILRIHGFRADRRVRLYRYEDASLRMALNSLMRNRLKSQSDHDLSQELSEDVLLRNRS
jgi:hypothetical protein